MAQSRAATRRVRDDVWDQGRDRNFDDRTLRPRTYPRSGPAETRAQALHAAADGTRVATVRSGGGWADDAAEFADDHIRLGRAPGERADRRPWGAALQQSLPAERPAPVDRALGRERSARDLREEDRIRRSLRAEREERSRADREPRGAGERRAAPDSRGDRDTRPARRQREATSWGDLDDMLSLSDDDRQRRGPRSGVLASSDRDRDRDRDRTAGRRAPAASPQETDPASIYDDVANAYAEAADRYARTGSAPQPHRSARGAGEIYDVTEDTYRPAAGRAREVEYEDVHGVDLYAADDEYDDGGYEDRYEDEARGEYDDGAQGTHDGDAPGPEREYIAGGRRTVVIRGLGAERRSASLARQPGDSAPARIGLNPDRIAMWAVLLGVVLILIAATSSHA